MQVTLSLSQGYETLTVLHLANPNTGKKSVRFCCAKQRTKDSLFLLLDLVNVISRLPDVILLDAAKFDRLSLGSRPGCR